MSLILREVRKQFLQGETKIDVLKGISMDVQDGEIVAILGQSGSGKSTLLSLLAGLDRVTSGSIQISDRKFESMSEVEMTRFRGENIGIVFQQFHLLQHLTALENVMLPLEILSGAKARQSEIQAEAQKFLEQMRLGHRMNHLPQQLSGGECQRVAIARALVVRPKILLADEPSGNLDTETGHQVMETFFQVVRENRVTTLLVTHSPQLAKMCDRQLVLDRGIFQ